MNKDIEWFPVWFKTQATEQEKQLVKKVGYFEDEDERQLFGDMLFREGTSTYELIKCQSMFQGSDEVVDDVVPVPSELANFEYMWFHFKVEKLDDCDGMFRPADQTLIVTPKKLEDDCTILHELIHLHEFVINSLAMYIHDMVYWALYKDLKNKIPELDNIITGHAHMLTGTILCEEGGEHDILFLLKSFDLDIRMGYPLGTVFAYGRTKDFESYSYKKD